MEESGKVVEVHGDLAKVEFTAKEACTSCGARGMCKLGAGGKVFTEALNEKSAKVGDLVRVEVDPKRSILTGLLIFIFPIIIFIAAFLAIRPISPNESYRIIGSGVSLVLYFILLKKLETWLVKKGSFMPVVREIIDRADS